MLEGLQDRLSSGVWYIPVSGLENKTPLNQVVPPCGKGVMLKRKPILHCIGTARCSAAPLLYLYSGVLFVSTAFDCFHFTGLRYLAVWSLTLL